MTEIINGHKIKKTFQTFPIWKGEKIEDTYGNKTILDYKGKPLFAELLVLLLFNEKGFEGVWVDSFRRTFRTELPEKNEPKKYLPDSVLKYINLIYPNGNLKGTWDLLLWKNEQIKFIELKRKGKDKIRPSQIEFLNRAIQIGLKQDNFEIFEWTEEVN